MSEKTKCILAYLFSWLGGLIVLYAVKDNERNTKYHAAQSIAIGICYMILIFISNFINMPLIGSVISIIYLLATVFGIIKACNEESPELPLVGELAEAIFGKKIEE